jgi:hypothetical protein
MSVTRRDRIILLISAGTVAVLVMLAVWLDVFGWPLLLGSALGIWFSAKMDEPDRSRKTH